MPLENFILLVVFAGVLVGTPGPANMLLMTAGANSGFRACVPLLAGVTLGKLFVHLSLALGLWQVIEKFPQVLLAMKFVGAAYIFWLAYKILRLKIKKTDAPVAGFIAGLIVHPINPKAWAMVVSAYGQFIVIDEAHSWWAQTIIIALVFFFWQCIAHVFWCWSGAQTAQLIAGTKWEKYLLTVLSSLMVLAVLWALVN